MRSNRNFMLGILTIIGILNFVDRQIMSILLEAIKVDLELSDLQLGLLTGLLFAVFYSFVGIPIARLADRWDRGKLVAISLFFWSAMTVLSGFANSFVHMALARMGIGLGEAGVAPSSHSLISDQFEAKKRGRALAVYSLGGTIGIFFALAVGGWVSDNYGWRMAFFVAGAPGILLSFVAVFLLKDPRKAEPLSTKLLKTKPGGRTLMQSLAHLWSFKSWRYAALATAFTHIATHGVGQFLPSFIIRSYSMTAAQTGLVVAGLVIVAGSTGSIFGGILADKLSEKRGVSWLAWSMAITFGIAGVLSPFIFSISDQTAFLFLLAPYFVLVFTSTGVQFAIVQSMIKTDMRATSSALLILFINLVGLGIGPTLVGYLSGLMEGSVGNQSLRYAMIIMTPFYFIGAFYFYLCGKALPDEAIIEEGEDLFGGARH